MHYKAYAFDDLNRQHTLSFSSSYPVIKCISPISHLLYLLYSEHLTLLMPCASKTLLVPVSKIYYSTITLFSYAFLLALVPIVQLIQNDLFDGGECGDEVFFFCLFEQLYVVNVSCYAGPLRSSPCVP